MHLFFQMQNFQLSKFDKEFCPIWIILFYAFICDIIKVKDSDIVFVIISCLIYSLLHTRPLLIPYAYNCILLSLLELKSILLISSVKTLCLSLLNHCSVFSIRLFFINSFLIRSASISFFF